MKLLRSLRKRRRRKIVKALANSVFASLKGKLVVVDVGAQGLFGHVYQPLLDAGLVDKVVGFEPIKEKADERNAADPHADIRAVALGAGTPETLYLNNKDVTSSMLPLNGALNARFELLDGLETVSELTMDTVRLDAIELPEVVDFVKLDVQGFEMTIMAHAIKTLAKTLCVMSEVEFQSLYKNQPLFGDVFTSLTQSGFDFHSLHDPSYLARSQAAKMSPGIAGSTLIWSDAVFFRTQVDLSADKLLRQAAIAALVFEANDVALELLGAYDAQKNTSLGKDFIRISAT